MGMSKRSITAAVKSLGGLTETGRLMEVTPQAVEYWIRTGEIPARRLKRFLEVLRSLGHHVSPETLNSHVIIM